MNAITAVAAGAYLTPPMLTQGAPSNILTLSNQFQGDPTLPQAGTLPPVSCAPCVQEPAAGPSLFWLAVIAGGLILLTARKRKPQHEGNSTYGFS